ncbi:DUF6273 domain-containing protein, partial [Anaerotignum sp.]|uniref:DUF6273 domain-containing protein n=1 Tax=Anaerotignum sp. TaxID=2039241 RepID=UPI003A95D3F0
MANKTTNYELVKPLASEFYDVEVQNGNMDKIDAGMKANADGIKALRDGQKDKADLVEGKVPAEQLPAMDYEAAGTAASTVKAHNENEAAHPYLLEQIGTCVTAAQNAQTAADAALEAVSSIAFTIDVVPTQSGALTYNGQAQSPSWNSYDSSKMTLGGTTSGTNAGSYNATFTPGANYKWSDGETGAKTVAWTIGKAAGSLSLNKTSMSLTAAKLTDTITVTRAGDGAISATSSDTGVATVSVSGTTVTVTAVAKGSATITVKVAAGTNYSAPSNKTCSVSVTLPTSTLTDNSWATIREVSSAGKGANYWAVGDMKAIVINGKIGNTTISNLSINVFILGFNHNSAKEGSNLIHFQIGKIGTTAVGLCDSSYNSNVSGAGYFHMNDSNTNVGGWNACTKRKTLYGNSGTPSSPVSNSLMAALPSDLLAVMQPVTKYTDNTGNATNTAACVTATTDYLFDLAEFEVFGSRSYANSYEQNYQLQYDYYKAGNSKVAYNHSAVSTAVRWGLRSPSYSSYYFCDVYTDGTLHYSCAYRSLALR